MLTKNIYFRNFKKKFNYSKVTEKLKFILNEKNEVINSLSENYKYSYKKNKISKFKKKSQFRVIGMGGSSLGAKAIYEFLRNKIKINFEFVDNLQSKYEIKKKNYTNLIISKSGNTTETIVNSNILIKNTDKNIFITENKKNYLATYAENLKAEIIHHNNFIGGRYSVLSEVGMLPAELMGLKPEKFKRLNSLIKKRGFINNLVTNVSTILYLNKKKKFNSVILNYDQKSHSIFEWYQQLVAESLGKKGRGILPIVSSMPKDNHSVMQLYLDGFKNNFFTFFYVNDTNSSKIKSTSILKSKKYLKNKTSQQIKYLQKIATENVFKKKNIPFRSFEIKKRDENTLGEIFTFFILETILLGKCLNLNPFDQPAVELIKKETKNLLI